MRNKTSAVCTSFQVPLGENDVDPSAVTRGDRWRTGNGVNEILYTREASDWLATEAPLANLRKDVTCLRRDHVVIVVIVRDISSLFNLKEKKDSRMTIR